ncbi:serine/threonine protein kinase [Actinoplanes bogorensis]|uniref:Serine/threonine protein kinase n=1 Tax=Paractinoplanes bogorensis TaxID=1610840 RepID=A0ABS5YY89_9ACTN|nr:serine/threonine-protein kinase [Actinoplanes bogorensis]MBU2668407.1 serine/threonine protein kinase [Actinoplanes bogorensis]
MPETEFIGRYRMIRRLGSGAFADVFLAVDEDLESPVAIKVLAERWALDPDVRERFLNEARLLRRIGGERLVSVHDIGQTPHGRPYFVMPYADRGTLEDRLAAAGRPIPPEAAFAVARAVALALRRVHEAGVVHRDVKPGNVLIFSDPGDAAVNDAAPLLAADERLVLGDLGLAKDLSLGGTALSLPVGTPGYMAPEQSDAGAAVDERADVYACTALLTRILTGRPPSVGSLAASLDALLDAEPVTGRDDAEPVTDRDDAGLASGRPDADAGRVAGRAGSDAAPVTGHDDAGPVAGRADAEPVIGRTDVAGNGRGASAGSSGDGVRNGSPVKSRGERAGQGRWSSAKRGASAWRGGRDGNSGAGRRAGQVGPAVRGLLLAGLDPVPARRPASAGQWLADLDSAVAADRQAGPVRRRRLVPLVAAGLVVLVGSLAAVLVAWPRAERPAAAPAAAPASSSAPVIRYEEVFDDTRAISIRVPAAWSQRWGNGWHPGQSPFYGNVNVGPGLNASPNVSDWFTAAAVPGVFAGVSSKVVRQGKFSPEFMRQYFGPNGCTAAGSGAFHLPRLGLTGVQGEWSCPGGIHWRYAYGWPAHHRYLVALEAKLVSAPDEQAWKEVLDSVAVHAEPPNG